MVALVENTHPGQQGIGVTTRDYPYEPLMTVGAILYGCPGRKYPSGAGATDWGNHKGLPYEPLMTVGAILYGCPGRLFFASCLIPMKNEKIN